MALIIGVQKEDGNMLKRIKITNNGLSTTDKQKYFGHTINWDKLVNEPLKLNYVIEAYASADQLIDDLLETTLKNEYIACKDVINLFLTMKSETCFFGLNIAKVLKKKSIISNSLLTKIEKFKRIRNNILHSIHGEYALLLDDDKYVECNDQSELDKLLLQKAEDGLLLAKEIFESLRDINNKKGNPIFDMDKFKIFQDNCKNK